MKLQRFFQKIFGQDAQPSERSIIGFFAETGTCSIANTIEDAQSLNRFEGGIDQILIGENSPTKEDMNSLFWILSYQIAYLMQNGIPEWNEDTEYYLGSICVFNNQRWKSRVDENLGNQPFFSNGEYGPYWEPDYSNSDYYLFGQINDTRDRDSKLLRGLLSIQSTKTRTGGFFVNAINQDGSPCQVIGRGSDTVILGWDGAFYTNTVTGLSSFDFSNIINFGKRIFILEVDDKKIKSSSDGFTFSDTGIEFTIALGSAPYLQVINNDISNPIFMATGPSGIEISNHTIDYGSYSAPSSDSIVKMIQLGDTDTYIMVEVAGFFAPTGFAKEKRFKRESGVFTQISETSLPFTDKVSLADDVYVFFRYLNEADPLSGSFIQTFVCIKSNDAVRIFRGPTSGTPYILVYTNSDTDYSQARFLWIKEYDTLCFLLSLTDPDDDRLFFVTGRELTQGLPIPLLGGTVPKNGATSMVFDANRSVLFLKSNSFANNYTVSGNLALR